MIEVVKAGFLDTIQDAGRFGFERFGVCRSGAMDPFALIAGNVLVGNRWDEAAIEITLSGPTLRFHQDATIAVTGANLSPRVDGIPIQLWETLPIRAGALLEFGQRKTGFRSYVSVSGGFEIPYVMRSKSTNLQAGFGGMAGRALKKGDRLVMSSPEPANSVAPIRSLATERRPLYPKNPVIRVILGPQDDFFSAQGIETLLSSVYRLAHSSDRMGCRLEGPRIAFQNRDEIISDGIPLGAVQVPQDGHPIILMADHQTVGGYPKIATVITADLSLIAQSLPGSSTVRFGAVSLKEAHTLHHQMYASFHRIRARDSHGISISRLLPKP